MVEERHESELASKPDNIMADTYDMDTHIDDTDENTADTALQERRANDEFLANLQGMT